MIERSKSVLYTDIWSYIANERIGSHEIVEECIRVGIFDDNEDLIHVLEMALRMDPGLVIVCKGTDGYQAFERILEYQPDVVLMDVIMPGMDGMDVMQQVHKMGSRLKVRFIVMSAVASDSVVSEAFSLGAVYYLKKPFDHRLLPGRIRACMDRGRPMAESREEGILAGEEIAPPPSLEDLVTGLIHELGVLANIKGYQYMRDAIMIAVENRDAVNAITKSLYPTIARMNRTEPSRVERAIRHAIELTWQKGHPEKLGEVFAENRRRGARPTNSEFIALAADRMRLECKKRSIWPG